MEILKVIFVVAKGIMNCKIGVKFAENCKIYRKVDIYRSKEGIV